MNIVTLPVGPLQANCYLVFDEAAHEALVIDPGADSARILERIKKEGLQVKYIINTHGHTDHIGANTEVKEATQAIVAIHEFDAPKLVSARENLSIYVGAPQKQEPAELLLHDGDCLRIGALEVQVIHTPGHSLGGICLLVGKVCFSGDTLFQGSIGRSDFPGGCHETLIESIKSRLLTLNDDVLVYPGHGPATSIGEEKRSNPYF